MLIGDMFVWPKLVGKEARLPFLAALIGIFGGIAGIILALIIAWLQVNYKLIPLQGGSFLIDYYPVELHWPDFVLVAVTVLFIALLASWIPARKAAKQEFSLRSE